jgi:glucose-1-phosphate adenylyltransferase
VRDSIVMQDARLAPLALVDRCIVDERAYIGSDARVGVPDAEGVQELTLVGRATRIPDGAAVAAGWRARAR